MTNMQESMVACCDCDKKFGEKDVLEVHLASEDLNWFPYHCRFCRGIRLACERVARLNFDNEKCLSGFWGINVSPDSGG